MNLQYILLHQLDLNLHVKSILYYLSEKILYKNHLFYLSAILHNVGCLFAVDCTASFSFIVLSSNLSTLHVDESYVKSLREVTISETQSGYNLQY